MTPSIRLVALASTVAALAAPALAGDVARLRKDFTETRHQKPAHRLQVLEGAWEIPSAACVGFLADVVRDEAVVFEVRRHALRVISGLDVQPDCTDALTAFARENSAWTPLLRPLALRALAALETLPPRAVFLEALAGEDPAGRVAAMQGLAGYGDLAAVETLVEAWVHADETARASALIALRGAVSLAIAAERSSQEPGEVSRWLVEEALGTPAPWPDLVGELLVLAGNCCHPGLRAMLLDRLGDTEEATRRTAVEALGRLEAGRGEEAAEALTALAAMVSSEQGHAARNEALLAVARIGQPGPALEAALEFSRSADPALRALALTALAPAGDLRAVEPARALLEGDVERDAWTALHVLRRVREPEAIEALVRGLKRWRRARVSAGLVEALCGLTGATAGDSHREWAAWWAAAREGFSFPPQAPQVDAALPPWRTRTRGPRRSTSDSERPTFYSVPITRERVAFVIDVSGSMGAQARWSPLDRPRTGSPSGTRARRRRGEPAPVVQARTRLEICQLELTQAIERLPEETRFNVIAFASELDSWKKGLMQAERRNRRSAFKYVARLRPTSATNVYDAIEHALLDPEVEEIFVLSDGSPNEGQFVEPAAIRREVRRLNAARGVTIHAIGVGASFPFLERLAAENGGQYVER